MQSYQTAHRMR